MDFEVDLKPFGTMLFIKNKDITGVVGKIGTILGKENINILGYLLSKVEDKDYAYSIIRINNEISMKIISRISDFDEIIEIKQLKL